MSHGDAMAHLHQEVLGVARFETGRLVTADEPAFFGAVRGVMCDLDYVAALYYGWDGERRDQISTKEKTIRFIREVMASATGNEGYEQWGKHLYLLYRHGVVHLRAPKLVRSEK